ncbi:MAG: hypothetical protein AB7K04_08395 [Pseudorhodoplanes sp.]
MRTIGLAFLLAFLPLSGTMTAHAEIKKFILTCDGKLCPHYEVVLMPPKGWNIDATASKQNRIQVIVPNGKTFGNAAALIYLKVSMKNKNQPLSDFIRVSQERWKQSVPDTKISRLPDITRENGKPAFEPYRYENPSKPQQAAEIVSFGIDADTDGNEFFVMAVMSSRSQKELDRASDAYRTLLRTH